MLRTVEIDSQTLRMRIPLLLPERKVDMHTFEAKIRIAGSVTYVKVTARDSSHARRLVKAQFGASVTVLQTKKIL